VMTAESMWNWSRRTEGKDPGARAVGVRHSFERVPEKKGRRG
jgi:hypothetical protein